MTKIRIFVSLRFGQPAVINETCCRSSGIDSKTQARRFAGSACWHCDIIRIQRQPSSGPLWHWNMMAMIDGISKPSALGAVCSVKVA